MPNASQSTDLPPEPPAGAAARTGPSPTAPTPPRDYVLGTHDDERARLESQHALWEPLALSAFDHAGMRRDMRVLDLGCGPGLMLESLVARHGPQLPACGIDCAPRFVEQARARLAARGHPNADLRVHDLMAAPLPPDLHGRFDITWCRWVAMFVRDPAMLVRAVRDALAPGGRAIFHEYVDYRTYALHPHGPRTAEFVRLAAASYLQDGGDADIGRRLPAMLADAGLTVTRLAPIARTARPGEPLWHWPAGFIRTFAPRLVQLGNADQAWADALLAEVAEAERAGPASGAFFTAPTVLEIVARKD